MHRDTLAHTISTNFRRARRAMDGRPSQEAFGHLIGRSRTNVVRAESGRNVATPETIALWARATGRDPFWFYTPHGDEVEEEAEIGAVA